MPTYLTHDITLEDRLAGTPLYGYMLVPEKGLRLFTLQDAQTIPGRVLSDAEYTQLQSLPEYEIPWYQANWQAGMGFVNHRIGNGGVGIAEGHEIDSTSPSGIIQLARQWQTVTYTVGSTPTAGYYRPTGFAMVGSEVWAFVERNVYSWDYGTQKLTVGTQPANISYSMFRNGVAYEGITCAPHWLTGDTPYHHIYKADADANWTVSTLIPAAKYLVNAAGKLWGLNIRDESDSTLDTVTSLAHNAVSSVISIISITISTAHTCTGSNRVLIVGVAAAGISDNRKVPSGITYNAMALTKIQENITGDIGVSLWRLIAPEAAGALTLTATFAAAFDACVMGAESFTGAHQTTVVGTPLVTNGSSASPSVSPAVTTGGIVIGIVGALVLVTGTAGVGETERWDRNISNVYSVSGMGYTQPTASGDTAITIAPTLSASAAWVMIGVEIKGVNILVGDTTILTGSTGSLVAVNDEIVLRSTATPAANEELMLVTQVNAASIVVTRGYKGTTAVAYDAQKNIYKATYNVHHVRSATDLTNTGAWGAATVVGTSDAAITGGVAYLSGNQEMLLVCKTDGLWTLSSDGSVTHIYDMSAQQDPQNFKGAAAWDGNRRVLLPLGGAGMFELYADTIRDISFSRTMPEQTSFHGRVVAVAADPQSVFVLVLESGATAYHLFKGEILSIGGVTDYAWHHVGVSSYITGTTAEENVLFACGVPSGATIHHRIWAGLSSSGSDKSPMFYTLDSDVQDRYLGDDNAYVITVKDDRGHPNSNKRYNSISFTTAKLGPAGTDHYIEVKYRVDGGAWTYVSGAQGTSTLTSNVQTLTFAGKITGKLLELQFLLFQGTTTTTGPQLLDFRVSAQFRPDAQKVIPLSLDLRDRMRIRNGALDNAVSAGALAQLRTWQAQAAEVTMHDTNDTTRNVLFLPGTYRENQRTVSRYHKPGYICSALLLVL